MTWLVSLILVIVLVWLIGTTAIWRAQSSAIGQIECAWSDRAIAIFWLPLAFVFAIAMVVGGVQGWLDTRRHGA